MKKLFVLSILSFGLTFSNAQARNIYSYCPKMRHDVNKAAEYIAAVLSGRKFVEKSSSWHMIFNSNAGKIDGKYRVIKWDDGKDISINHTSISGLKDGFSTRRNRALEAAKEQLSIINSKLNINVSSVPIEGDINLMTIDRDIYKNSRKFNDYYKKFTKHERVFKNSRKINDFWNRPIFARAELSTCEYFVNYDKNLNISQSIITMYLGEPSAFGGGAPSSVKSEDMLLCTIEGLMWSLGVRVPDSYTKMINGIEISNSMLVDYLYDENIKSNMTEEDILPIIRKRIFKDKNLDTDCGYYPDGTK